VPRAKVEPRHPVHIIEWLDASDAFPSWGKATSIKASDRTQLVQSIGYLVSEDDEFLTIATSCVDADDEEHFGGGIHIPKVLVKRRTWLA